MSIRAGLGYDVHRLAEGRRLILGGVDIPFDKGLLGHSDADVLVHAIMDSMLGAVKLGDIGKLFPDNDPRYEGISSLKLLRLVSAELEKRGWSTVNIDSIIVMQRPKLRPYIPQMEQNIAQAIGVSVEAVSVKATTEEELGFTGEGEGVSAKAVCLVERI